MSGVDDACVQVDKQRSLRLRDSTCRGQAALGTTRRRTV